MKFYVYNRNEKRLYTFEPESVTKNLLLYVGRMIEMSVYDKKSIKPENIIKGELLTHGMAVEIAKTDEILKSLMPDDENRGYYDEFTVTGTFEN